MYIIPKPKCSTSTPLFFVNVIYFTWCPMSIRTFFIFIDVMLRGFYPILLKIKSTRPAGDKRLYYAARAYPPPAPWTRVPRWGSVRRMWGESGADVGRVCRRDSAGPSEINEGESVSISGKPHLRLCRQVDATPGRRVSQAGFAGDSRRTGAAPALGTQWAHK